MRTLKSRVFRLHRDSVFARPKPTVSATIPVFLKFSIIILERGVDSKRPLFASTFSSIHIHNGML